RDIINERRLAVGEVVDLATQAGEGLAKAHDSGIIHRDIKPSNIIVDGDGRLKILDFGLASVSSTEELTASGYALGTVGYISPEQIRGEKADERSDIFSFGVVLYQMLTGRQPFRRDTDVATMNAVLTDSQEPVSRSRGDVPAELQRVVDKSLEKDRRLRYQHVDELLADLRRLESEPVRGLTARRWWRRYRKFSVPAVLVLAAVCAAATPACRKQVLRWLGFRTVPYEKHLAVLPFANLGKAAGDQAFCDGLMETVSSKLTQLEQFQGSLHVVPASEVRAREIASARSARHAFGVTLAVTGSVQRQGDYVRMTLNLVDATTERQLRSSVLDNRSGDVSALQDSTVVELAGMLEMELRPLQRRALAEGGTSFPKAYDRYVRARGHLQDYQRMTSVDLAIELLDSAIAEDPAYALAHAALGEAYWRKHRLSQEPIWIDRAVESSQRAIELNNQMAPVFVTLGLIHKGTGRYEEAVGDFKRALLIDSTNHETHRELATAYEALNRLGQAEATYRKAIELKPDFWAGPFDLALFYFYNGRNQEALRFLRKAEELAPEAVYPYNDLGAVYLYLGRLDDSRRLLENSIEIEPNYAAYSNLGALNVFEKRHVEAARMYEEALKLDDHDYRVWINLAGAYQAIPGQREKMLATYRRAIELAERQRQVNPRDAWVLSHLADSHAAVGDTMQALTFAAQALAAAPENVEVTLRIGLVYETLGRRDLALDAVHAALDRGASLAQIKSTEGFENLLKDRRFRSEGKGRPADTDPVDQGI
ncbi:MAG: tetratricopeptide repeat protein, partial [candidate division Zixibacteria bacterium]|nr:tetratricopeptide repeat protein [candidate division Zixibacteria bacterium]